MAIAAAITFIISTSYSMNLYNGLVADVQQRAEMYTKLEQIDTYVRAYYNGSINEDKLIESLAQAYISVLGSDSAEYYDAEAYTLYKEHLSGTHLGIGIYADEVGGCPCVTDVLANSPAAMMGVNIGDSIVEINGQSVIEMGYDKAYSMLRAENGTPLTITLRAGGEDRTVDLSTVQMTVASVKTDNFDGYGYIKVYEFSEKTYQQFMAAYSMVFNLLNSILPQGSTPYISTALSGEETSADSASGNYNTKRPITVLVNSRTKGPAELLAASLADNCGARIIGSQTAGNAQLRETYALYDNTAISLPIATLKAPQTQFSGTGIKPEYEVIMLADTEADLIALDSTTDGCIKKAIEVLSQTAAQNQ